MYKDGATVDTFGYYRRAGANYFEFGDMGAIKFWMNLTEGNLYF